MAWSVLTPKSLDNAVFVGDWTAAARVVDQEGKEPIIIAFYRWEYHWFDYETNDYSVDCIQRGRFWQPEDIARSGKWRLVYQELPTSPVLHVDFNITISHIKPEFTVQPLNQVFSNSDYTYIFLGYRASNYLAIEFLNAQGVWEQREKYTTELSTKYNYIYRVVTFRSEQKIDGRYRMVIGNEGSGEVVYSREFLMANDASYFENPPADLIPEQKYLDQGIITLDYNGDFKPVISYPEVVTLDAARYAPQYLTENDYFTGEDLGADAVFDPHFTSVTINTGAKGSGVYMLHGWHDKQELFFIYRVTVEGNPNA